MAKQRYGTEETADFHRCGGSSRIIRDDPSRIIRDDPSRIIRDDPPHL